MNLPKGLVALRVRFWMVRKWWRTRVRRRRKFVRVVVDAAAFSHAKLEPKFTLGIHILRFASTIRSYQRVYLRLPDDGSYANTHDRVRIALLLASTVYESLEEFRKLQKDLRELESFGSVEPTIKRLTRRISGSNSFQKVLYTLRNKVMYHFDRDTMIDALAGFPASAKIDVVLGETGRNADTVYPLVEDALLGFAMSKNKDSGTDLEKYEKLQRDVLHSANDLIQICSTLAIELLHPWIHQERSSLFDN